MSHQQKSQFGLRSVFAIVFVSALGVAWRCDHRALVERLHKAQHDAVQERRLGLAWEIMHKYRVLYPDDFGLSTAPPDFEAATVEEIQQLRDELNKQLQLRGLLRSAEWGIPRTAE